MKHVCNFIIFFIILYCFSIFSVYADIDKENSWNEYIEFRDSVYNYNDDLESIKNLYLNAVESANLYFTGNDLSIALSRCDFILGLYYVSIGNKELASECFDTGLSFAELVINNQKNNYLACLMYTENLCQNCGVKPLNYVIKNGPKIQVWAKKTLELNSNCGSAMYLLNAQYIYAPSPFSNYKKGISEMSKILKNPTVVLHKDDLFNIYYSIGYGYMNLGNNKEAMLWFNKALEIYPKNYYLNMSINKINF